MACPTCSHTMQGLGSDVLTLFWCPRCGTISRINGDFRDDEAPKLVERCREFEGQLHRPGWFAQVAVDSWQQLGIAESIHPGGRNEQGSEDGQ